MSKDLKKAYDHSTVEEKLYQRWMERGYFSARPNPEKKPFPGLYFFGSSGKIVSYPADPVQQ